MSENKKNEAEAVFFGGLVAAAVLGHRLFESIKDKAENVKNEIVSDVADLIGEGEVEAPADTGIDWGDWMTPALTAVVAAALAGVGVEEALRRWYRVQAKKRTAYFQVIPHSEFRIDGERIRNLAASLHQANRTKWDRWLIGREWFQLYFVCVPDETREDGRIEIYCGFPQDRFSFVKKKLEQSFPLCGLKRIHWSKVPELSTKGRGGYVKHQDPDRVGFPLQTFNGKDQMTGLLDHLTPGSALAITFSPTTPKVLKRSMKKTRKSFYKSVGFDPKAMKKNDVDPDIRQAIDDLDMRERKSRAFEVKIAVWQEKETYGDIVQSIRDELNSRLAGEYSGFRLKRTLRNPIQITPYSVHPIDWLMNMLDGIPFVSWQKPLVMLNSELESLLHLPNGKSAEERAMKKNHLYNRIEHIVPGQSDIPHDEFTQGVKFGYLLNPVQEYRPVHLLEDVMRKMGVIIGKTGSGKTAIALMACLHVIQERLKRKNGGLTIVDPKKTFAYTLLTWLNKWKLEGLLTEEQESLFRFYDVTSKEFCFSINPMEKTKPNLTEEEKMEIVNNTLEVMMSTYPNDSILFERYGSVAIKALLEDPQQEHNILAIAEFIDKESPLRNRLYNFLKHGNAYQKSIAREIERLQKGFGATECQTVYNRLHRLASNPRTKRIFGQTKTTIKPLESMEKGLITIYNIEGLSQSEIKLVMGFIAMEYHKWANHRKNRAENHYLWIDEAHEVQLPVFWEKIIPKDREMGLCLWLLTQSLHQFKEPLLDALKEIGGSFVSCIAGEESAKVMQKITTGRVKATDIQNYRALTGVVDTEDSSGDRVTFMIKADPPFVWDHEGEKTYYGPNRQRRDDEKNAAYDNAWAQLGWKWMERDCRPVTEVDKEISDYLESLWKKPTIKLDQASQEVAATINVVAFQTKKEPQKAVVGSENPFAHLLKEEDEAQ